MRPEKNTYPEYFGNYIPLVKQENIIDALKANEKETVDFFSSVPSEMENYAYDQGKWTIKQVLNHLVDTERVFAYRSLRFARKDEQQPLSFDQDNYVANSELDQRSLKDLITEFESVRRATLSLFGSFSREALLRSGHTKAGNATVLSIGFTICGHNIHHMNVVRERYLGHRKNS